jgi:peptidoglycan/LPS O-acetylase OafA/YrhL
MSDPRGRAGLRDRLAWALYALCAALLVAGLAVGDGGPLALGGWFGLSALIGFLAVAAVFAAARLLRPLLRRPEGYYDR